MDILGLIIGLVMIGVAAQFVGREQLKKERLYLEAEQAFLERRAKDLAHEFTKKSVKISFPLIESSFTKELSSILPQGSSTKGVVELCYDGVMPEDFKFHYRTDGSEQARDLAIAQSLFGEKALKGLHFNTEIISTGRGELVFRRRFNRMEDGGGKETVPRLALALSNELLDVSVELVKAFSQRDEHRVERALMTRARSGNPGALEVLINEFSDAQETQEVLELLQKNRSNPKLRESIFIIAMLVDRDVDAMVEAATEGHFSDDYRKRACRALIRWQDENAIVRVLDNPPFGLEVDLIEALQTAPASAAAQDVLFKMLDTNDDAIMLAAAKAFQRIGSRVAIMPLNEFRDQWSLNADIKEALELAVEKIQERLGEGGGRGGLSVVETDDQAGELSLASEQKGRVALAKKQGVIKGS